MKIFVQSIHDLAPVILVAGLYGLFTSFLAWRRGLRAAAWPTVEGRITQSKIRKGKSGSSDMGHGNGPKTTVYTPEVTYSYEVGGIPFQSTRVQFGRRKKEAMKQSAQESVSHFVAGLSVTVFYNPEKPEQSVLRPGVDPFWKTRIAFAFALLIIGAGAWIASV